MHLTPDSPHKFTEREEMQALRKLVFGIDEEKSVQQKGILEGIRKTSWLPPQETTRATDRVSKGWGKFPGIVSILWMALGETTKITAA
jgi:hypothetical protein